MAGLAIANNSLALTAQHNLGRSTVDFQRSLERLSSGLKVNRGADGPAALVISEKQRAQIAGLNQAIDNSEKAVALVQTAEGALTEINNLLVKVRSLAIDSANSGVNDEDALAANQAEIDNALDTINRIANNTQFGTKKLLDGSAGIQGVASQPNSVTFLNATEQTQEGQFAITVDTAGERASVESGAPHGNGLAADEILTINGVNIDLVAGLTQGQVVDRINDFTAQTGVIADTGGTGGATRLYTDSFGADATLSVISNLDPSAGDTSEFANTTTNATGTDVVVTIGTDQFTGNGNVVTADGGAAKGLSLSIAEDSDPVQTVSGASGTVSVNDFSLVFQIGPNQNQSAQIAVGRAHSTSLGIGVAGNQFANLSEINVSNAENANDTLGIIDAAIDDITNLRGRLGAFQQNTLESTANNLRATLENTINAESVIRDTDFAEEISEFTKQQVLQQAGASVLSSANQVPQLVLSLLG